MANDYVPHPNARFHAWQNNFVTYINGHLTDLGLAAGDVVDLNNSAATLQPAFKDVLRPIAIVKKIRIANAVQLGLTVGA